MTDIARWLNLVIPDGSMQEVALSWLKKAGIITALASSRVKIGVTNVPFINTVTLMRPQAIPVYLEKGFFQIGIVGEDWIQNWRSDVEILFRIPVARASNQPVRIVLAVPKASGYQSLDDLPLGSIVVTEYVELVEQYLRERGRSDVVVMRSYGGTESFVHFGATAVVDVTETGTSLVANGLEIIEELMVSNTVIAANKKAYTDPELRPLFDWFVAVIDGAVKSAEYVLMQANVPEDKLDEAVLAIGGMMSPTKSPLAAHGWTELSSYIERRSQHEVIFRLLQLGVRDICISDAVSMVMGTASLRREEKGGKTVDT